MSNHENLCAILQSTLFNAPKDTKKFPNLPTFSTRINTFIFSYANKTPTYSSYIN